MGEFLAGIAGMVLYGAIFIGGIWTWCVHIGYCFTHGEWGFLIAGAIIFPLANIHGLGIMLGWWG